MATPLDSAEIVWYCENCKRPMSDSEHQKSSLCAACKSEARGGK